MSRVVSTTLLAAFITLLMAGSLLAFNDCSGQPIKAYNDDPCGLTVEISVEDSATACQIRCVFDHPANPGIFCGIDPQWIGGRVELDPTAEFGFIFVPETVVIAEIVIEQVQTSVCKIAENPKAFSGSNWFVPYNVGLIK